MRLLAAALAVATLIAASGCGYIAGVQPPLANIPTTVAGLDAVQRGANLIIHFGVPTMTTEGLPIRGALDFDVRVGVSPDPWNESQWQTQARRAQDGSVQNGVATFSIRATEFIGKDVAIAARTAGENQKWSLWSKYLALPVVAPLARPEDLRFTPEPKGIRFTWRAKGEHFRVLRREGDDQPFGELATTTAPEYFDSSAVLGHTYTYQVLTFAPVGENHEAQSDLSEAATIAYRDVFPPAAPAGVRSSASDASVELSWESNDEPDLAGYRVYRAADGGAFEKIGETALPAFSDKTAQRGHSYRYTVTAVDQAANESPRSAAVEAALR